MNEQKREQLIAWLESMPWWDELPYANLKRENEEEHEQVCQFIRDMYTGRFAEREEHYWELPQWIRDAIEADPIYNSPAGE